MPIVAVMTDRNTYQTPVLISIGEAARLTGVTVATVRNWDRKGKITAIRTPGGQRRFRLEDIQAILDEQVA